MFGGGKPVLFGLLGLVFCCNPLWLIARDVNRLFISNCPVLQRSTRGMTAVDENVRVGGLSRATGEYISDDKSRHL